MEHFAIDVGGKESQICIRAADGTILLEKKHRTVDLERLFRERPTSRVIVETAAESFRVADQALAHGHEVRVVPATLVRSLGVGARGIKTDMRDARALSEVSSRIDLPSVHIPTEQARQLKSICGAREALIGCRTKLINNVRGWLRTQLWRVRSGGTVSFPERVRGHSKAHNLTLPPHVERVLSVVDALNEQLREADKQLAKISAESPICRRLMTVPGVGPVTAVRFVAAVDNVSRFGNAHSLQSYLGITPGEMSSSSTQRRTGITKAGPSAARWALVQAAWCARRTRPRDPMVQWAEQVARRRGTYVAAVALARKMAGVLYAIWRDGTSYAPSRAASDMS
jgi:transposase